RRRRVLEDSVPVGRSDDQEPRLRELLYLIRAPRARAEHDLLLAPGLRLGAPGGEKADEARDHDGDDHLPLLRRGWLIPGSAPSSAPQKGAVRAPRKNPIKSQLPRLGQLGSAAMRVLSVKGKAEAPARKTAGATDSAEIARDLGGGFVLLVLDVAEVAGNRTPEGSAECVVGSLLREGLAFPHLLGDEVGRARRHEADDEVFGVSGVWEQALEVHGVSSWVEWGSFNEDDCEASSL